MICTYASKIIPALQSRCTRFRFAPLSNDQALSRLEIIAKAEACDVQEGGLDACVALGTGDMRKSINILQSTHMAFGKVDANHVYRCTGAPMPQDVQQILQWLFEEDFAAAFGRVWELMREKGLALVDIVSELHKYVAMIEVKKEAPMAKAQLIASLADVEQRLAVGTTEKLQLGGMVGIFQQARAAMAA